MNTLYKNVCFLKFHTTALSTLMTFVCSGPRGQCVGFLAWKRKEILCALPKFLCSHSNSGSFALPFKCTDSDLYSQWIMKILYIKIIVERIFMYFVSDAHCSISTQIPKMKAFDNESGCTKAQVMGVRVEFIALQCYFSPLKKYYPSISIKISLMFTLNVSMLKTKRKNKIKEFAIMKAENFLSLFGILSM